MKIYSMTGFGRAEFATDDYHAKVEMQSVNRKNGEVVIQLPKALVELEAGLRKLVLQSVQRGRVQVSVIVTPVGVKPAETLVDEVRLKSFLAAVQKIEELTGKPQKLDLAEIIRVGGILSLDEQVMDVKASHKAIEPALINALAQMVEMRAKEGEHMQQDIASRIELLELEVTAIEARAPGVVAQYREALLRRLKDSGLALDLDDERVLKEVGVFAERCDISEETTRLRSHFLKFDEYLNSNEPTGRSLDFLCQEMNREFNTIGSKANDAILAQHVVNCKTELEKAREQVQNIE